MSPLALASNIVATELVCPSDVVGFEKVTTSSLPIVMAVASALDDIPETVASAVIPLIGVFFKLFG